MSTPKREQRREYRDQVTGQYAFCGDMDRVCVCGHRLGAHIAGGFECGTNPSDFPETKGCGCERFRLTRRKLR